MLGQGGNEEKGSGTMLSRIQRFEKAKRERGIKTRKDFATAYDYIAWWNAKAAQARADGFAVFDGEVCTKKLHPCEFSEFLCYVAEYGEEWKLGDAALSR